MQVVRSSCLAPLFVVAVAAAALGQIGTDASAQTRTVPQSARSPAPAQRGVTSRDPIVIEFDVPDEFRSQPAGSSNAVTGFRVGYFKSGETTPIRTIEFGRDTLIVRDRAARVSLSRDSIPDCGGNCDVRVQTLAGKQVSAWSEPLPVTNAVQQAQTPPSPRPPRPQQPRASKANSALAGNRAQRGLAASDLERYAALSESLSKLLPKDADLAEQLRRFRRVDELALAVVLSRDYGIPFTTLSQTLAGPPRVAPRNAIAKLRSDVDAREAVRKSRAEAQKLTRAPVTGSVAQ